MTANHRPEAEQLVASANGVPETQCMCDSGVKEFPDPTARRPLSDERRFRAAAGRSDRNIPRYHAATDKGVAFWSSALGLQGQ